MPLSLAQHQWRAAQSRVVLAEDEPHGSGIDDFGELLVAWHEAAHAIASLVVGGSVSEIRLGSDMAGVAGEFRALGDSGDSHPDLDTLSKAFENLCAGLKRDPSTVNWVFDRLVVSLAPLAFEMGAEIRSCWESAASDIAEARTMAAAVMDSTRARNRLLDRALVRAATIVDQHREHIFSLGRELAQRRRMMGDDVKAFLRQHGFLFDTPILFEQSEIGPALIAAFRWRGANLL